LGEYTEFSAKGCVQNWGSPAITINHVTYLGPV